MEQDSREQCTTSTISPLPVGPWWEQACAAPEQRDCNCPRLFVPSPTSCALAQRPGTNWQIVNMYGMWTCPLDWSCLYNKAQCFSKGNLASPLQWFYSGRNPKAIWVTTFTSDFLGCNTSIQSLLICSALRAHMAWDFEDRFHHLQENSSLDIANCRRKLLSECDYANKYEVKFNTRWV